MTFLAELAGLLALQATKLPCCKFGVRADGAYCDCQTGRDLKRADIAIARESKKAAA